MIFKTIIIVLGAIVFIGLVLFIYNVITAPVIEDDDL
jgi:hypothetical protein